MSNSSFDTHEYPLAIFSPLYGVTSETFIRRHIEDILPGRTVAIAYNDYSKSISSWDNKTPKILLDKLKKDELDGKWACFANKVGIKRKPAVQLAALRKFLHQKGCRVFMGEYLHKSLPFLPVAKGMGLRFFVHAHGFDISQKLRDPFYLSEYKKYRDADGIITVNQLQKGKLVELGLPHEKIHVIPCGVDIPESLPESMKDEHIQCLSVGRMVAKKAPLLVLDAFKRAVQEMPQLRLNFIGNGPLFKQVKEYVAIHNLQRFVILHGELPVEQVHSFMKKSDCFIQHSIVDETGDEEGLPVAILEAMAHALPVIATRHAGIPEAVLDNETGLLVDEGDTFAMATALMNLASSQGTCEAMGKAGRARAREYFSAQRELTLLRKLLLGT